MKLLLKTWNQNTRQCIGLAVIGLLITGCQSRPSASQSAEPACSTITQWQTANPSRGWTENTAWYQNASVRHRSLYMQDYFESHGGCDGHFQIYRKEDVISLPASPALFVANIIKLPVDLVQSPPWQKQVSRSIYPLQQSTYNIPYELASQTESIAH